jgi:hypothetical protein
MYCVRVAAPEGFSDRYPDPALTNPGLADRKTQAYSSPSKLFLLLNLLTHYAIHAYMGQ